jgi:hypothetical protein
MVELVFLLVDQLMWVMYLGDMIPHEYHFNNIVVIQPKTNVEVFHDEYWFAHRINHKSGNLSNCQTNKNGVMRAIQKIGHGDEIFMDYNRDSFCKACNKDIYFFNLDSSIFETCANYNRKCYCWKSCKKCKRFLCVFCYDNFQINV